MREEVVNYEEWVLSVPEEIKGDSLWKMEAYRLALFTVDIGWQDATKLIRDKRTVGLFDQLYRSLGSIAANLAEGYSRSSGKDRARFYEYALGSARESRGWYYQGRLVLGADIMLHRLHLLTQIIRLLLTMVPQQRAHVLHEPKSIYQSDADEEELDRNKLENLLRNIPKP